MAFAIAVETEADIFLVDEALAVGDAEFQDNCLQRFKDFKREGKTIIFASHNMDVLKNFCEKSLYLLRGEVKSFGPTSESIYQYIADTDRDRLERSS